MRDAASPSQTMVMPCQKLQADFGTGERGNGTTSGDARVGRHLIGPKRQGALAPHPTQDISFSNAKPCAERKRPAGWLGSEMTERMNLAGRDLV